MKSVFTWESKVRDYELDSQGIVNHATFLNYFEQCRNDYARLMGIDFREYQLAGYDLMIADIQIQYRSPLRAKDEFYVTAQVDAYNEKRILFGQEIKYKADNHSVAKALVSVACVDQKTGRACMPNRLKNRLPAEKYVKHRLMLKL
ncbi:acyl-CoA thioesterase [Coxiella burnetii]|uniref:acyl-CoA thioesterase n=1 Tax=Coxiella burnetii TaxID=777 RepID=UPI002175F0BB|nr:thioesterase family protein [Coxiella burnetii]